MRACCLKYMGQGGGGKPKVKLEKGFSLIGYTDLDLGIVKLHFEIGAGKANFEWGSTF